MRRRKRTSPVRTLFLWTISLTLIGWGLWQAEVLRRSLIAAPTIAPATLQADAAVDSTRIASLPPPSPPPSPPNSSLLENASLPAPAPRDQEVEPELLEPTPVFDPALSANDLVAQGSASLAAGQTLAARFALNEALVRTTDAAQADQIRQTLVSLNGPIFLGSDLLPDDPAARMVEIQEGDNFVSIARLYGLNAAFLQILNPALATENLKLGTGIKIVQGPFAARIVKHAGRLDLYARELYVASCPVDFPEGNLLPRGDYLVSPGTKLQLTPNATLHPPPPPAGAKMWIGFQGLESGTQAVTNGWIFGTAGPRGNDARNRVTGVHVSDADLQRLFDTLTEGRSHIHVEP